MKISMVSGHANPLATLRGVGVGSQHVHVAELSAALVRAGHEVTVYTRHDSKHVPRRVRAPQGYLVVHVPVGPPRYLTKDKLLPLMGQFGAFLKEEWTRDRPHIVHAHFWMSGIATQLVARSLGLPAVQTFHALGIVDRRFQGPADTSPPSRIRLEQLLARGASRVIATCSGEVFELARIGLPRDRASMVPCGVDVAGFTPGGPVDPKRERHRLVMIGRLVPSKGFDLVIEALTKLPDTELIIAGGPAEGELKDDAEAARLLAVARELRVAGRVRMLGRVSRDAMPSLLRSADVVGCTPWCEASGIVPLEAMACGTPVVAAAVGALLDTVVDGVTGRLLPTRDPDWFAEVVRGLFTDETLRAGYGMAGRDRAQARYSWDRVAADTLRAYQHCLSAPGTNGKTASGSKGQGRVVALQSGRRAHSTA